jgi:hypothetical protein
LLFCRIVILLSTYNNPPRKILHIDFPVQISVRLRQGQIAAAMTERTPRTDNLGIDHDPPKLPEVAAALSKALGKNKIKGGMEGFGQQLPAPEQG